MPWAILLGPFGAVGGGIVRDVVVGVVGAVVRSFAPKGQPHDSPGQSAAPPWVAGRSMSKP
ncbi:MAG: hypothetical protein KJ000_10900 [Pirellulaceae bacterium]|nr:hypothetical protein [Pirellulaceae bacterium]